MKPIFLIKKKDFEIDLGAVIELILFVALIIWAWNTGQQVALEYHKALEEKCPCLLQDYYNQKLEGHLITEQKESSGSDYRLAIASSKIYYRTGGKYWINPYTLEIEPFKH